MIEDRQLQVTFIRHAESEDNLKVKALCEILVELRKLKIPTVQQLMKCARLLEYDLDSSLSVLGKRQVVDIAMTLETRKFWDESFDYIVHSPLIRATETCLAIVPAETRNKCLSLNVLCEITPFEQLMKATIERKMTSFENWLRSLPTHTSKIVVVGHCQYFNNLLGMKTLMRNCDVWRSTVTLPGLVGGPSPGGSVTSEIRTGRWEAPVLFHRSALSEPHPIGKVIKGIPWLEGWSGWGPEQDSGDESDSEDATINRRSAARGSGGEEVEDDLTDEPVCRICQARQSETPGQRMLRPCMCSGSVSYVHLDCLNHWRSTSQTAYFTCSICRYNYNIQRTFLASLLVQESFVLVLAVFMVLSVCFSLGLVVAGLISALKLSYDPVWQVLVLMRLDTFWLHCLLSSRFPHKHATLRASNDLYTAIYTIYSSNQSLVEMLHSTVQILQSPLPLQHYLCHPYTSAVLNIFLLGAVPVGGCGFFGFFITTLEQMRLRQGGLVLQAGFMIMWLASLGTQAISRLTLVVGGAIAIREVYSVLLIRARVVSNWFGDHILEPHR